MHLDTPLMAVALFSTSLLSLLLGTWALLDAPRKRLNHMFFLLCASVAGWTATIGSAELTFARGIDRGSTSIGLGYLFGSFIPFLFLLVCRDFNPTRSRSGPVPAIALISCLMCVFFGFNGFIVHQLSISTSASYYDFQLGWGFFIFIVYVIALATLSGREIFVSYYNSSNTFVRLQLKYFAIGAGVSFAIAILCNLALPALSVSSLSPLGAVSPIFSLCTISLAITRHRLLDLKISFRQSATIGIWLIFLLIPIFLYLFIPGLRSFNAPTSKALVTVALCAWAMILYVIARTAEQSFVKLGGDKAFIYRDALDSLARSLVGVVSASDVMTIASEYLRSNHGVQGASLWSRSPSGSFMVLTAAERVASMEACTRYFETLRLPEHEGESFLFGIGAGFDTAPPPANLGIRGLVILPRIRPGTLFIVLFECGSQVTFDRVDIALISSFSNYTAAALKSSMQMEEIDHLNYALAETKSALLSYNSTLERLVEEKTAVLRSQLESQIVFVEAFVHDISNHLSTIAHDLDSIVARDPSQLRARLLRLSSMVHDSNHFLATDAFTIEWRPCNLTLIVQELIEEYKDSILSKQIQIEYSDLPEVYSDQFSLRQILSNLLTNAIKYVGDKEASRIDITCVKESGCIVIRIADNGIGIAPRELNRVFRPLYRGSNQEISKELVSGSGLGLSIANRLSEKIGATISMTSRSGAGTQVSLRLPIQPIGRDVGPS